MLVTQSGDDVDFRRCGTACEELKETLESAAKSLKNMVRVAIVG